MGFAIALCTRREVLKRLALGAAFFSTPGAFAEQLFRTPPQTEGPFYPNKLPLDTDNDLLMVNDRITPAVGEIVHLTGRILGPTGAPVRNALVEIWQVDANGVYLYEATNRGKKMDGNFQGFGRFLTGSSGEYYFRTIRPALYPGRTRHIHFAIDTHGERALTTQLYVKGEPKNATDGVLSAIKDPIARESVIRPFLPVEGSPIGELQVRFDIVLGQTPEDPRRDS